MRGSLRYFRVFLLFRLLIRLIFPKLGALGCIDIGKAIELVAILEKIVVARKRLVSLF